MIIEKPFGHDLDSARKLNGELTSVFRNTKSIGSIITLEKRRPRICWYFALATRFLSRSGIGAISIMSN